MRQSTNNLLQRLAQNTNASFNDAQSLPPAIYHDSDILNLEIEQLFRKEWVCLGRSAEIPEQGDFLCRDIVDAPVFVVRQRDEISQGLRQCLRTSVLDAPERVRARQPH